MAAAKPKLIVFDLDYTLWPYWCDTHIDPPFSKNSKGEVRDARGQLVKHYPEVPEVLEDLHAQGYLLGVASRTGEVQGANQLIRLFGWDKFFSYKEIYPGCKINHFKKLRNNSGLNYDEMLFFDDEPRNGYDMKKIGVLMIRIDEHVGVNKAVVQKGLQEFALRAAKN
ncbi:hypothetical protein HAZT_HAZT002095 [Hyalella azteca]|uniref:Magnesium-dependent phosphatase 1-like n=1 Tax=Hyalella azteca TaxID=294128 RepID=A0A6A0H0T0_HYAAZ|nr:magnesium-dependent phosphatase 1-like [Hyalella azteca]KAA0195304.1 hypothetical protein HAZT_HAZT002095 [Hyalella azteca]